MLKYRRLIKNLINRPREPAITDISSTRYPPTTVTSVASIPTIGRTDRCRGVGGWLGPVT